MREIQATLQKLQLAAGLRGSSTGATVSIKQLRATWSRVRQTLQTYIQYSLNSASTEAQLSRRMLPRTQHMVALANGGELLPMQARATVHVMPLLLRVDTQESTKGCQALHLLWDPQMMTVMSYERKSSKSISITVTIHNMNTQIDTHARCTPAVSLDAWPLAYCAKANVQTVAKHGVDKPTQ